ncbi:MAG: hypothetical protein JO356_13005 [Acidobacteria bacterium]|nr:hypothetical protein [Acidobacteriota bacterium]
MAAGRRLTRAETVGPPEIVVFPPAATGSLESHITADKFTADFQELGQLRSIHGEAHARVLAASSQRAGEPQGMSSSDTIDVYFRSGNQIENLIQQGHFLYRSGDKQAFAERARYTPGDEMLELSGSPRVVEANMTTTAEHIRLNRSSGEGIAQGAVKTTYSDWKPQPGGSLLAGTDPVHVTAGSANLDRDSGVAIYHGSVRLWQNANMIAAPSMRFERDQRTFIADSSPSEPVSTVLEQSDIDRKTTAVRVTSSRLVYREGDRVADFEGGVLAQSTDFVISAEKMKVFLAPQGKTPPDRIPSAPAKLERIVALGAVRITQPGRQANGEQLTYTAPEGKFVLSGGTPSIFDAEHGKITGVSLTYFRRDDRVVVDGDSRLPAVTHTRVVR